MMKQNLTEVNSMVNMAILAADEMDALEDLVDVDLVTKTLNLRSFYNTLANGIVSSISSLVSDDTMYYLKNANKYLQLTLRLLNGSVASGTPTSEEIEALKNSSVKGLGVYVVYIISAIEELSQQFKDSDDELAENSDLYLELLDSMSELKELVDQLDIIKKYGEVDYLKEFNVELSFSEEDFVSDEEATGKVSDNIIQWATGSKAPLDFGDFEEEE